MRKKKILLLPVGFAVLLAIAVVYLSHKNVPVLDPAGQIGSKERALLYFALALSAIVVIPVFGLTIMIAIKYREGNEKAKYTPEWDRSKLFESIWWGVPIIIIGILTVVTWNSSHALDPYKPIASKTTPLTVDVVALDWKWLFIYPSEQVASVNRLDIPLNTPINLRITSATVMNSFWVPNLSGQIYAMPGMTTQLHLIANKTGKFYGSSANISGEGFAGMNFYTYAESSHDFNHWIQQVRHSGSSMTSLASYNSLASPSQNNPVSYYSSVSPDLFNFIVNQGMGMANTKGTY